MPPREAPPRGAIEAPKIVLLGPAGGGKTTVAAIIAEQLGRPMVDLDEVAEPFYEEVDWSIPRLRQCIARIGRVAAERAWEPARAHAVFRAVQSHPGAVLALGAGHGSYRNQECRAQVARALAPVEHVVLLVPSADRATALRVLRERCLADKGTDWVSQGHDFLAEWVDDRGTRALATHTSYTENLTPLGVAHAVLSACGIPMNRTSSSDEFDPKTPKERGAGADFPSQPRSLG